MACPKIPYTLFIAGCVDLVDDKLDHMLWKVWFVVARRASCKDMQCRSQVFGMVDEDFSGEIETVAPSSICSRAGLRGRRGVWKLCHSTPHKAVMLLSVFGSSWVEES